MKWIKNGNQLINMGHVSSIEIVDNTDNDDDEPPFLIVFSYGELCETFTQLKYGNLETAEAHLEAIAMFLENTHQSIMAMAPTQED